jgi:hypothetical protein
MSFTFRMPGLAAPDRATALFLPSSADLVVPVAGVAVIPHGIKIVGLEIHCLILLLKVNDPKYDRLLVDSVVFDDPVEEVCTRVFNIGSVPIRIKRNMIVSRLVSVRME